MKVHLNNSIQDELCINYYISTAFACDNIDVKLIHIEENNTLDANEEVDSCN